MREIEHFAIKSKLGSFCRISLTMVLVGCSMSLIYCELLLAGPDPRTSFVALCRLAC
jgi:hypothetical protein